ncbi:MAG TPA: glycosyltransferase family 87 protein [Bacteroidia bacterium]|nr:glycosyltransferase family 87 protein [Bacteroidia bacterium]
MKQVKIPAFLYKQSFLVAIFVIITLGITAQSFLKKMKTFDDSGALYTQYNNYVIFKQSYFHLIQQEDLYKLYPTEHWDLYKYSPSFSVMMAPMALFPDTIGLFIWNLLNVLVLFFALWKFPHQSARNRMLMLAFVLIELITSTQNAQSNALIAGLFLLAFIQLEKNNSIWASLFIVLTIYIKLFGIVALAMFLFYPNKLKSIIYICLWTILIGALPLLFVSMQQLSFLYSSWWQLLKMDHGISTGLSVAGWLYTWFGIDAKTDVVLVGTVLFCLPMLRFNMYRDYYFRVLYLVSIMLWVIIFNHRAESATFIIAVGGVAVWYFSQKPNAINTTLIVLCIIFSILSPTDLFPKYIRINYVIPYVLKAVPCILIWGKIVSDLLLTPPDIIHKVEA